MLLVHVRSRQGLAGSLVPVPCGVSWSSSTRARRWKSKAAYSYGWQIGVSRSGSSAGAKDGGAFVPFHQLLRLPHSMVAGF